MTLYLDKLLRIRVLAESAFGTDGSGTMGSYLEVPFAEGTANITLDQPMQSPMHAQQRADGYPTEVLLPKSAKLDFECNLETFTTKATSTVAATKGWLGTLLESAIGASHLMTGTLAATNATTTSIPVSVATTLRPGAAIGLNTGTGSALEVREIKSKSGSTLTLKLAATGAPSTGATVLGAATYYPNPYRTGATYIPIQFACEGHNTEDRWLLKGGALESLSITLAPGQIPKLKFAWMFADFDQADGAATSGDLVGPDLAQATYTNVVTLVQADSEFRVPTVGTNTLTSTLLQPSSIEFKPNMKFVAVRTPSGVNTVLQYVQVHEAPVLSGSFTIPYEASQAWFDAQNNRTAKAIFYQIGSSTSNGAALLSAPNVQITRVQRANVDGVQCQVVEWKARLDSDTTAESGQEAIAAAAWRLHLI